MWVFFFFFFIWPLLHSVNGHWTCPQNRLPNWWSIFLKMWATPNWMILFTIRSSSQSECWASLSPSQQFSWVRVHLPAFRLLRLLRFKMNIKASLLLYIGYIGYRGYPAFFTLTHPSSYRLYLTIYTCSYPLPLSPTTHCVPSPEVRLLFFHFSCSAALLFFSACFSCCLVCRPCFIWFSLSVTRHSTRTATVWEKLSASWLI